MNLKGKLSKSSQRTDHPLTTTEVFSQLRSLPLYWLILLPPILWPSAILLFIPFHCHCTVYSCYLWVTSTKAILLLLLLLFLIRAVIYTSTNTILHEHSLWTHSRPNKCTDRANYRSTRSNLLKPLVDSTGMHFSALKSWESTGMHSVHSSM